MSNDFTTIDGKIQELIAVGASVTAHCQPCLSYHIGKAKELGVTDAEINDAIGVGHMVEKGAMSAINQYAEKLMNGTETAGKSCCEKVEKNCC